MRITRREDSRVHAGVMDITYTFQFSSLIIRSGVGVMRYIRNTGEKWELLGTEAL